jgi:tetratricopeptide (TPR) repeat protein
MTEPTPPANPPGPPPAPRRRGAAWLLLAAALAAAAGVYVWHRGRAPEIPPVDVSRADPAVADVTNRALEAIRNEPRSASAWGRMGMLLIAHQMGNLAAPFFAEAARLDPLEPRWPYLHGLTLVKERPAEAVPLLRRAVELCGDEPEAPRLQLAEVLFDLGSWDEARQHFEHALSLRPDSARAHLGLARLAFGRGDFEASRAHLERVLPAVGGWKQPHALLAQVLFRLGQPEQARKVLRRSVDGGDEFAWPDKFHAEAVGLGVGELANVSRAGWLLDHDRAAEAVAVMESTVRDYPKSERAWVFLGRARLRLQQFAGGEQAFRTALELAPGHGDANFYMGVALSQRHEYRGAADYFRRAIAVRPHYAWAQYNLGQCLKALGESEAAAKALRAALEAQPDYAEAYASLGELLARQGRTEEAVANLLLAVRIDPDVADAAQLLKQLTEAPARPAP